MFKNEPFVIRRYDADITILPMKYLDELRLVSVDVLSSKKAAVANFMPKWTNMGVMATSDLHIRVLNNRLNPNLPKYLSLAKSELDEFWTTEVPQCEDWTVVDIQDVARRLVSRMSASIFLGYPACRNEEWLDLSVQFSIDMFTTAFTLRAFPPWMHFLIAPLIPARWRTLRYLQTGRRIIGALMKDRAANSEKTMKEDETLLGWMVNHGTKSEVAVAEMSDRQCLLTLASIHTTSNSVTNLLFNLCEYPEWIPILREEIESVAKEQDGTNVTREWLSKLMKLDSFIVETLRLRHPIMLSPQRLVVQPITLKDGTYIPAGTRVAWAAFHHAKDPANITNPEVFDPMRSFRKRQESPELANRYSATQINSDNLAFGYGSQACAGRHFAVGETKMMMARLLTEFDIKFVDGQSRPESIHAGEMVFLDPDAKIMLKKRATRSKF
ncbi:hypothetical protein CHU98_g5252 [Xylaria longipes]|nr:hypothetical protein CHU98_g5252 [Xylaria longipes]